MDTQNLEFAQQGVISASVVPDELRIGFWPQHFGSIPQWITLNLAFSPGWTGCVSIITAVSGAFRRSVTAARLCP
jgi:hypothetical protein